MSDSRHTDSPRDEPDFATWVTVMRIISRARSAGHEQVVKSLKVSQSHSEPLGFAPAVEMSL